MDVRAAWLLASLIAGCGFSPTVSVEGSDAAPGRVDAAGPDGSSPSVCAGHFLNTCEVPGSPTGELVLEDGVYVLSTDDGTLRNRSTDQILVTYPAVVHNGAILIYVERVVIRQTAALHLVGSRGVIIASASTIEVEGFISASSYGTVPGAGAGLDCELLVGTDGSDTRDNGGGGAGGSFGGTGGDGGGADSGEGIAVAQAGLSGVPTAIRGGCSGGIGGIDIENEGDADRAAGGFGGGAVVLNAADRITVHGGRIAASGAGGQGADRSVDGGGGGGGSGGLIALESPVLELDGAAIIAANGGGGGQGARFENGGDGSTGLTSNARAAGGSLDRAGRPGGDGSGQLLVDQSGITGEDGNDWGDIGGGGGGGGAGFIVLDVAPPGISITISPDPRTP